MRRQVNSINPFPGSPNSYQNRRFRSSRTSVQSFPPLRSLNSHQSAHLTYLTHLTDLTSVLRLRVLSRLNPLTHGVVYFRNLNDAGATQHFQLMKRNATLSPLRSAIVHGYGQPRLSSCRNSLPVFGLSSEVLVQPKMVTNAP